MSVYEQLQKAIEQKAVLIRYIRKDGSAFFREIEATEEGAKTLYEIVTYKGEPFGAMVAVAIPDTNTFCVGVSVCCKKDLFDKTFGRETAFERATWNAQNIDKKPRQHAVPDSVLPTVISFIQQAKKYFQDKEYVHVLKFDEALIEESEDILAGA